MTWITLALAAGVPLELVQRVTGHRTVEVVLKHYFRPGREDFKQRILSAMPRLLTDGDEANRKYKEGEVPTESLVAAIETLKNVTGKENQEIVYKAVELIEKVKNWYDGHVIREPEVARA